MPAASGMGLTCGPDRPRRARPSGDTPGGGAKVQKADRSPTGSPLIQGLFFC